jgi:hypothetical protein
MHVADPFRRRIAEARHEFARSLKPCGKSQNPAEPGLSNHGPHDRHLCLRICGDGLLGTVAKADRMSWSDDKGKTIGLGIEPSLRPLGLRVLSIVSEPRSRLRYNADLQWGTTAPDIEFQRLPCLDPTLSFGLAIRGDGG